MKSKEQIREEKDMELLNKFANDHVCATHIQVDISHHHKSFKPRNNEGAKYEDCNLLSDIIMFFVVIPLGKKYVQVCIYTMKKF